MLTDDVSSTFLVLHAFKACPTPVHNALELLEGAASYNMEEDEEAMNDCIELVGSDME